MSLSLLIGTRFSRAKQRNKFVSFISLSSTIGIAVGVAVIIIGLSAMNGFERELEDRVLSVIPQAELYTANGPMDDWQQVVDTAKLNPRVDAGAPYIRFTGLVERGAKLKAVEVRGLEPSLQDSVSSLSNFIDHEAWHSFVPEKGQIILGKGIADALKVTVGDSVSLLIPPMPDSGADRGKLKLKAPKRVRLTVSGLLSLQGQVDHNLVLIPLGDAQTYQGFGTGVTGVSLKVSDVFLAQEIVQEVGSTMATRVFVKSWKEDFGFLHRDIELVRSIMYLVMVLVIGVATFNIVTTLMMSVKDRASDIAILRTMGASDSLIRQIFIWYGTFSGVSGAVVGSIIGVLLAFNLTPVMGVVENIIGHHFLSGDIYFVDFLPSKVVLNDVLIVSGTAIILSLLATLYPAQRATKLDPARVLSAK